MDRPEASSLDRFLWRRANDLLDSRVHRAQSPVGHIFAYVQAVIGIAVIVFAVTQGGDAVVALLFVGSVLTIIGGVAALTNNRQSVWKSTTRPLAAPSHEGQRLLHKICTHIGYANYQDELYGRSLVALRGMRTSSQVLRNELFELLDSAALQFNRIDGVLQERATAADTSLRALAPVSRAAALECMAIIVNHAAWIDTFPENQDDHRSTILDKTSKLQELADRLSALTSGTTSVFDSLAARTLMDEVLDKISLEEAARNELRPIEEDASV